MIVSYLLPLVITLGVLVAYCAWQTSEFHRKAVLFFVGYVLSMVVWALGIWISLQMPTGVTYTYGTLAFLIGQVTFIAAGAVFYLSFEFISRYRNADFLPTRVGVLARYGFYLLALIMLLPNTVMINFSVNPAGYMESTMGPGAAYFSLFLLFCYGLSLRTLYCRLKNTKTLILKNQFKIMLVGYGFFITGMLLVNWILPVYLKMPQLNNTGPLFYLFEASCFFYAVTRYRFLDLKLTLYRLSLQALNLGLYLVPMGLTIKLITEGTLERDTGVLMLVVFSMVLVSFYSQTLELLTWWWRRLFYAQGKTPTERIAACLDRFRLSSEQGCRELEQALNVQKLHFMAADAPSVPLNLEPYFKEHPESVLVKDELEFLERSSTVKAQDLTQDLEALMAAAIVPVKNNDQELIGFLVLEQKINGNLFSVQELSEVQRLVSNAQIHISRERDYARSLEKLKAKGRLDKDFVDGLMHEIRHPLMIARNVTDMIDWAKLKPEDQAFLKESETSLQDLSKKLELITEATSWVQGTATVQKTLGTLEQLREFIRQDMVKENPNWLTIMDFKWESSDLESDLFYFDMTQMKRVFVELGKNASFFKGRDKLKMTVRAFEDGDDIVVHYTDNGIGIDKQYWDKIFDLMFVISPSRNQNEAGLGLGLTIARGIMQAHGGTIKVLKSDLGKGTTFEIRCHLDRYKG